MDNVSIGYFWVLPSIFIGWLFIWLWFVLISNKFSFEVKSIAGKDYYLNPFKWANYSKEVLAEIEKSEKLKYINKQRLNAFLLLIVYFVLIILPVFLYFFYYVAKNT